MDWIAWCVLIAGMLTLGVGLSLVAEGSRRAASPPGPRVTGLGGVFFKVQDRDRFLAWYREHLGVDVQGLGVSFHWRSPDESERFGRTVWGPFPHDTEYFGPSDQRLMINYRVHDLDGLLAKLRAAGVEQAGAIDEYWYGRFAWVVDVEGNRVELWEPVDFDPVELARRERANST